MKLKKEMEERTKVKGNELQWFIKKVEEDMR